MHVRIIVLIIGLRVKWFIFPLPCQFTWLIWTMLTLKAWWPISYINRSMARNGLGRIWTLWVLPCQRYHNNIIRMLWPTVHVLYGTVIHVAVTVCTCTLHDVYSLSMDADWMERSCIHLISVFLPPHSSAGLLAPSAVQCMKRTRRGSWWPSLRYSPAPNSPSCLPSVWVSVSPAPNSPTVVVSPIVITRTGGSTHAHY